MGELPMNRKIFLKWMLLLLALPLLALIMAAGEYGFMVWIWAAFILMVTAPILLASAIITAAMQWRWRTQREALAKVQAAMLAGLVAVLLLIPAGLGGMILGAWRIDRAVSNEGPTVAALDDFKARTGRYPASFEEAEEAGTPIPQPWFAAPYDYSASSTYFSLDVYVPSMGPEGWSYNSKRRAWKKFH